MAEHDTAAPVSGEQTPAVPPELPVLPLRDTVLFPNSFMPLAVARESSVAMIDDAIAGDKQIGVFKTAQCRITPACARDLRHRLSRL